MKPPGAEPACLPAAVVRHADAHDAAGTQRTEHALEIRDQLFRVFGRLLEHGGGEFSSRVGGRPPVTSEAIVGVSMAATEQAVNDTTIGPRILRPIIGAGFRTYESWRHRHRVRWTFPFDGAQLELLAHPHNTTWLNERTVEIPVALHVLEALPDARVLEVGNVLANYCDHRHEVVDKYERAAGVMNTDIVDFHPDGAYDLVVSISTIEHIGWDEDVREPEKIQLALEHLRSLLAPGGMLLVTVPAGYNPWLDQALRDGRVAFEELHAFRRAGRSLRWIPAKYEEVAGLKLTRRPYWPRAVFVGIDRRPGESSAA